MGRLIQDVKFGTRFLLKHPGFTILVVATLGLGIGASTAIFSVVNRVLIEPLPYPEADELVLIRHNVLRTGFVDGPLPFADVIDYRDQVNVFEGIAATDRTFEVNLTGEGSPEVVRRGTVTSNFFDVLGVKAVEGRTFGLEDGELPFMSENPPDGTQIPRAVISYGLWLRRFGEDPEVIGREIQLDEAPVKVIGVLPRDFHLHMPANSGMPTDVDVWQAVQFDPRVLARNSQLANRRVIARLADGVSLEEAQLQVDAVAAWQRETFDYHRNGDIRVTATPMLSAIVGHVRPILLGLFAAVGIVLLIASANVAGLLLIQATAREKEIAIRAAVGGGRRRIARQLLTESLLLATAGGLFGLLIARWGIDLLLAARPANLPRLESVPIDAPVLLFTVLVTLTAALLFGLVPALQSSQPDLRGRLSERGVRTTDRRRRGVRGALVASEVALAMVLLVGAGLMYRSLRNVESVDLGFQPDSTLTFNVRLPVQPNGIGRYGTIPQRQAFFAKLEEKGEQLEGVDVMGATQVLPLRGQFWTSPYQVGEDTLSADVVGEANYQFVTPGLFEALGMRLVAGRLFDEQENAAAEDVVVVDRGMAARAWPGETPIGKRVLAAGFGTQASRWFQVIGVVESVHIDDPLGEPRETLFFPHATQGAFLSMTVVARSSTASPEELAGPLRELVAELDPLIPLSSVRPHADYVSDATAPVRFATGLIGLFALLAVVLAAIGVYGVVSSAVRQRTQEIGLQLALGAPRPRLMTAVVARGVRLAAAGLAVGLLVSLALARLMSSLLTGVSPTDPLTYAAVAAGLIVVAALASIAPARRAIRVDPMDALRYE